MKKLLRFLLVLAIALLAEVFVINGKALIYKAFLPEQRQVVLTLADAVPENWDEADGALVSQPDPILMFPGVVQYIDTLDIQADIDPAPPSVEVFYLDADNQYRLDDTRVLQQDVRTGATAELKKDIYGLRVDLGEAPGLTLRSLSLSYERFPFSFSLARVIAMVAAYWLVVFLFSLQKQQTYDELRGEISMEDAAPTN